MGTPYMSGPHTLEATGAEESCTAIRVPWRAIVRAFKFNQVAGVAANCAFELYTKSEACPPTGSSESSSGQLPHDRSMYSVFGEKSFTASTPLAEYDKNYPYVNQDSKASNPTRLLYVRILPAGTGAKTYELALELEVSNLT
jgi:hypothetical protein